MSDRESETSGAIVDVTEESADTQAASPRAAVVGVSVRSADVVAADTATETTAAGDSIAAESPVAESNSDRSTPSGSGLGALLGRVRGAEKRAVAVRATAALLLGVALASSVYFFLQDREGDAVLAAHEQARAAACEYAPVLANYDAKNLDAYFTAVLAGATGDWKKQFDDTSRELKEVLSQGEVVSKTNDVQCAIKSGDETSAEAIVVIGQTITSLGTQGKPAPGQLSMVMRMEKQDGKWLVNKVNSPLAPTPQP